MSFRGGIHQGAKAVNILLRNEESTLNDRKKDYKIDKIIAVIGTLVLLGICIGVLYLRFRVLGR